MAGEEQSIHFPVGLKHPEGSYALLTDLNASEPLRAVVFVHGFKGDPYATWVRFQQMIGEREKDWWATCDLFFFKYDSVHNPIATSSYELRAFLNRVYVDPEPEIFEVGNRTPLDQIREAADVVTLRARTTEYSELTLVGHSEGGLVIRHAVAEIARAQADDCDSQTDGSAILEATLRLFAPAIAGVSLAGLAGLLHETPGIRTAAKMWLGKSSAYKDMQPEAIVLRETRARTDRLARRHSYSALRADVLWAAHDQVVTLQGYEHDSEGLEYSRGHGDICKPSFLYPRPLTFVKDGLAS